MLPGAATPLILLIIEVTLSLILFMYRRWDWKLHIVFGIAALTATLATYYATVVQPVGTQCILNQTATNTTVETCRPIYGPNPYAAFLLVTLAVAIVHIAYAALILYWRLGTYVVEDIYGQG